MLRSTSPGSCDSSLRYCLSSAPAPGSAGPGEDHGCLDSSVREEGKMELLIFFFPAASPRLRSQRSPPPCPR